MPLLLKQLAIRTGSIFIVKMMGLIGRVSLIRLVGAEGIGLYQIAYSYYGLALMVIVGGFPTVLAMLTAKDPAQGWFWFRRISLLLIGLGGVISYVTFLLSPQIAEILGNPNLHFAIRCIAPALFVVPLLSLLRGYLQGLERYSVIAFSELIEQAVRMGALVVIVILLLPKGSPIAVGGGILGTFLAALVSFLLLIFACRFIQQDSLDKGYPYQHRTDRNSMFSWILHTSLIISFTRLLVPLSDCIDAIIIPNRLQAAGFTASEATSIFGVITGMAMIVVYMPTIVTAALSHTLTMKIVSDWKEGQVAKFYERTRCALELGWVWGCTAGILIFTYSKYISWYIFGTYEASEPIRYLAAVPLLVGLRELTTSMLWAQERKKVPLVGLIVGICIAIPIQYFLVAVPGFSYAGPSVGILCLELVTVSWNIGALKLSRVGIRLKPLIVDMILLFILMLVVTLGMNSLMTYHVSNTFQLALGITLYSGGAGLYIFWRSRSMNDVLFQSK
ncbi:oligosaccharide flippase family protein [Paenibacillus terrigena]|uniref:oligosaccharide flippase family protein n=1 Tax=Paenibacillus terrigena TaxID=369333 RepID=UPI00037C3A72|nr:oligosaccharide flippase family protein [Paenibacillus terrigena]